MAWRSWDQWLSDTEQADADAVTRTDNGIGEPVRAALEAAAPILLAYMENEVKAEVWADAVLAVRAEFPSDDAPDPLIEAYSDGLSDAVIAIDRLQSGTPSVLATAADVSDEAGA